MCEKYGSTNIAGGAYMVQNDEWGASDGQCITATDQGFTVDSGDHHKDGSPAAYPSIMSGCWMGTCTTGTTLPQQISGLGPISSSIAGKVPDGVKSNFAYDIWADPTAKKNGQNSGMELMIWLKENGGIKPIGSKSGTATIGGATWDVWKGTNGANVISYVRQGYVDSADNLPITDFVKDAVKQGSAQDGWYLTNIQAGFEPWTGGPGLALTKFSVDYGGAQATGGALAGGSSAGTSTSSGTTSPTTTTSNPSGGTSDADGSGSAPAPTTSSTTTSAGDGNPGGSGGVPAGAGSATNASWSMTNGLTKFKSTPWNNEGATDPSAAASPNVPGRQAVMFDMPSGGKRTEAEPDVPEFQQGQTKFVGYSGMFAQGFPVDTEDWQLIMQFKQPGTGSPPLAVEVGKGQLRLANNGTGEKDFCPVAAGQAFNFQLGITFGGTIDAWCNGKQTLTKYKTPASNVDGSAYLKTGIYRDTAISGDSKLYLNDLKVGDSLASVSGLAGAPASGGSPLPAAAAGGAGLLIVLSPAAVATARRRSRRARHLVRNSA